MNKKMYVDVTEVCEDWGVSRAQGYRIIKQLNDRMLAINPNLIVLSGKANRKFYEENCYGMTKQASGIGKTEFAKIVSEKMFPQEELIKINFGIYSIEGVLNSLIGSPLGYVGSEEGGELINKIKKSKSKVILIDEFEKATSSVYNFFYELLEDGIFTDRHGEKHDLNGYIIVFTSNMSQKMYQSHIPDSLKSRFDR